MNDNNERYFISIIYNDGGKSYCFGTNEVL